MRTLVDIPDEDIEVIDALCQKEHISRAEAIRRAVRRFINEQSKHGFDEAVGSWKDVKIDGVEYQRSLRKDRS